MSKAQTTSNQIQVTKIHKLPLILKKNSIKPSSKCGMLFRCLPGTGTSKTVIKEDVIYKSVEGDFLQGKYPGICLINRLDVAKNCSSTVASYKGPNGDVIKLTSDAVVKTIGHANYDQVIASLCCVFNQELKVKGILALLSETIASPSPETKKYCSVVTQTYESSFNHLIREKQRRSRNLGRSQVKPYIVPKESQIVSKKLVIHPATFMKLDNVKVEFEETNTTALPDTRQNIVDNEDNPTRPSNNLFDNKHNPTGPESNIVHLEGNPTGPLKSTCDVEGQIHFTSISKLSNKGSEETRLKLETIKQEHDNECTDDFLSCDKNKTNSYDCDAFPELNQFIHEDSIISDVSVSNLSIGSLSIPGIERNAQSILNYIDRHTEFDYLDNNQCASEVTNLKLIMVDGSTVTVKGNPDPFHIATPDILKDLTLDDQKKLMLHQAYLDWKYCLQRNEDNNLPIHIAVLNNDVNLVNRQCLVLKSKNESIDIAASGNLTALQMAVFQDCPECTAVLLAQGADLMVRDDEARTVLHLAAEIGAKHVEAIVEHCYSNARQILKEHCELWKPELENKTDDKLVNYLLIKLSMMYDNQGYTPLMLASKLGNDAAVRLLVYAAPSTVNMAMPTCGNTALYLACAAACTEALNRGDKTKIPENYKKTIEILIANGADPAIENSSGTNVTLLLTEFQDITLSYLISSKLSGFNGCDGRQYDTVMLVKDAKGVITVKELNKNQANSNHPKVYTNSKGISKDTRNTVVTPTKEMNTKLAAKPSDDVKKTDTAKPVILKNLPVITKISTFGMKKVVSIKDISLMSGNDKGLLTQITTKSNPKKPSASSSLSATTKAPKFLKILPKPAPKKVISNTPIILKNALKRHISDNSENSPSSSSKIKKT